MLSISLEFRFAISEGRGNTAVLFAVFQRTSPSLHGLGMRQNCASPVVKVLNHGRHVMSLVPLKTHRVGQRCPLNLSRAQSFSPWCGVVVRRGGSSSGVIHVT
ncbi:hypothetical protein TNCV_4589121 [Trichonephila clavipes]|nr:hypothetical protein TNCV_4589121 [Trichonephila clavipes]